MGDGDLQDQPKGSLRWPVVRRSDHSSCSALGQVTISLLVKLARWVGGERADRLSGRDMEAKPAPVLHWLSEDPSHQAHSYNSLVIFFPRFSSESSFQSQHWLPWVWANCHWITRATQRFFFLAVENIKLNKRIFPSLSHCTLPHPYHPLKQHSIHSKDILHTVD